MTCGPPKYRATPPKIPAQSRFGSRCEAPDSELLRAKYHEAKGAVKRIRVSPKEKIGNSLAPCRVWNPWCSGRVRRLSAAALFT